MTRTSVFLAGFVVAVAALSPSAYCQPASDTAARLQQLEEETVALRAELQSLQQRQAASAETSATLASQPAPQLPAMGTDIPSLDDVRGEIKKYAWKKGDFSITPYGTLWATATYETERTNTGDYVLWVYSPTQNAYTPAINPGEAFHVDAKSSRFGLDVLGPQVPALNCAQSGGKVEIDFQRSIDTENKPSVLLRHAYVEVKDDEFRLLAGQTWDVISPLYPGMLMYTVGWDGGNIGYRRAQFRAERRAALSDEFLITTQGSINTDLVSESAANLLTDHAGWPILEGRVAVTLGERGKGCRPVEFGVSGHVGEQVVGFLAPTWVNPVRGLERETWSFNVDLKVPLTPRFGVQGEFFTGENLGTFLGGIGQGIDIGTPAIPGSRRPIRSTGGWFDVWFDWTAQCHSHAGYSLDDPFNQDVTVGRIYNSFVFGNLTYDLTKQFLVGMEVTSWKTLWVNGAPGNSVNTAAVVKYNF